MILINKRDCMTAVATLALLLGGSVVYAQQYPAGTQRDTTQQQNTRGTEQNGTAEGNTETHGTAQTATHPMTDKAFAEKAAQGSMAEVKLGELAQQKGATDQVKDFGKRMVTDHSKANDELKSVASQQNISKGRSAKADQRKAMEASYATQSFAPVAAGISYGVCTSDCRWSCRFRAAGANAR